MEKNNKGLMKLSTILTMISWFMTAMQIVKIYKVLYEILEKKEAEKLAIENRAKHDQYYGFKNK